MRRLLTLVALLLATAPPAYAAIGIEASGSHVVATGTASHSISAFTITSGTVLLCGVSYTDGSTSVTSVVWDSAGVNESLTQLVREREAVNTGYVIEFYYKKNPTAASSKNITLTLSTSFTSSAIACASITGADTTTTFRTAATADTEGGASDPVSVTATSVSGDRVFDVMHAATTSSAGMGQTAILDNVATAGEQYGFSWKDATTTTTTMTWSKDAGGTQQWVAGAVAVIPTGGGGAPASPPKLLLLGVGE